MTLIISAQNKLKLLIIFDDSAVAVSMRIFLNLLLFQRNLPEGMAMKVTKFERKKLPEIIEDHINESTSTSQQE